MSELFQGNRSEDRTSFQCDGDINIDNCHNNYYITLKGYSAGKC